MPRRSSISASRPLTGILAFFALSLACALALDRAAFSGRGWLAGRDLGKWGERQWVARKATLAQRTASPDLLVVGDSAAGYGVWPGLLAKEGFNLSRPGLTVQELDSLDERLLRVLKARPKVILLGMLWFQFVEGEGEFAFAQGNPPTWPSMLRTFYSDPNRSQKRVFPGSRVARYWSDSHLDTAGSSPRTQVARFREDGSAVSLLPRTPVVEESLPADPAFRPGWFDPRVLGPLERFKTRWEQRGVPVLFNFLPLHPALRTGLQRQCPEDLARWRSEVQRRFGDHCIDFEASFPEAEAFRDGTHLTEEGARRLTQSLAPRVEPFLRPAVSPRPADERELSRVP